jgi:hypothetical protein
MGQVQNRGARDLQNNTIVWASDTIKARLSRTSESINKDTTVMTGLGFSGPPTDVTLASKTFTEDTTNDRIVYGAANFTFSGVAAGAEIDKIIIFKFVTNDAGSTPIAVVTLATPITPGSTIDIVVTVSASGLFYTQQ